MSDFLVDITIVAVKEVIKIAIPPTIAQAKALLRSFAESMDHGTRPTATDYGLPTAALLGLGRCGTNVCTEVARLLEQALAENAARRTPRNESLVQKVSKMLNLAKEQSGNPYLFQPVILLADLDQQSTVQQSTAQNEFVVPGYERCRLIDIRWLFKQGCGNVPQVGQYLTRLALKTPLRTEIEGPSGSDAKRDEGASADRKFANWSSARSYFLDTVGLNENASRLMFFVFSTGGGTGSGMSPELGTAQRFLAYKRALDNDGGPERKSSHQEYCCSIGLGIMPTSIGEDQKDAQSMNTGRLVLNYLARLERYRVLDGKQPVISELDLPPFDCLALVSNDIMTSGDSESKISFESAAQQANVYISQQIFNLLVAQSLPTDYLTRQIDSDSEPQTSIETVMSLGGIEKNEMIRLDPADLKNSLYGVSVIGYAESKDTTSQTIPNLVLRAVSPPTWNKLTESVDGLSILPLPRSEYEDFLKAEGGVSDLDVIGRLSELPLFRQAITVVTIVSVPKAEMLKQATIKELRSTVVGLFRNAKIRRYAVLPESSGNLTITFFIGGSGYFTQEVLDHIKRYLLNSFCLPEQADTFEKNVDDYVMGGKAEVRSQVEGQLQDIEDITQILATLPGSGALIGQKIQLEARAKDLLGEDSFPLQSVFLTKKDVLDALDFMKAGWAWNGLIQPKPSPMIRARRN